MMTVATVKEEEEEEAFGSVSSLMIRKYQVLYYEESRASTVSLLESGECAQQ